MGTRAIGVFLSGYSLVVAERERLVKRCEKGELALLLMAANSPVAKNGVEPAGLPVNDFSSPLGSQNRGSRQKPCTTLSDRIRGFSQSSEGLTPFCFSSRFANATTPSLDATSEAQMRPLWLIVLLSKIRAARPSVKVWLRDSPNRSNRRKQQSTTLWFRSA